MDKHGAVCDCSGVKDAVVDAVEELYLKCSSGSAMDPRQAGQNLVGLAQGSSLGASDARCACYQVVVSVLVGSSCLPASIITLGIPKRVGMWSSSY